MSKQISFDCGLLLNQCERDPELKRRVLEFFGQECPIVIYPLLPKRYVVKPSDVAGERLRELLKRCNLSLNSLQSMNVGTRLASYLGVFGSEDVFFRNVVVSSRDANVRIPSGSETHGYLCLPRVVSRDESIPFSALRSLAVFMSDSSDSQSRPFYSNAIAHQRPVLRQNDPHGFVLVFRWVPISLQKDTVNFLDVLSEDVYAHGYRIATFMETVSIMTFLRLIGEDAPWEGVIVTSSTWIVESPSVSTPAHGFGMPSSQVQEKEYSMAVISEEGGFYEALIPMHFLRGGRSGLQGSSDPLIEGNLLGAWDAVKDRSFMAILIPRISSEDQ